MIKETIYRGTLEEFKKMWHVESEDSFVCRQLDGIYKNIIETGCNGFSFIFFMEEICDPKSICDSRIYKKYIYMDVNSDDVNTKTKAGYNE